MLRCRNSLQHSLFCSADVICTKSCAAANEKLHCNVEIAALQESGAFLPLSCGLQAPHLGTHVSDLLTLVRKSPLPQPVPNCREEHSMDQYRSRLKLSENFQDHWSILISGEIHMDQSLVHTFSWGNSYGPMVLKVLLKFPPSTLVFGPWMAVPSSWKFLSWHLAVTWSNPTPLTAFAAVVYNRTMAPWRRSPRGQHPAQEPSWEVDLLNKGFQGPS